MHFLLLLIVSFLPPFLHSFFWRQALCVPSWPGTCYVAKDDLKYCSSCLLYLSSGATGVYQHAWFMIGTEPRVW